MFRKPGMILLLTVLLMICAFSWTAAAAEPIPEAYLEVVSRYRTEIDAYETFQKNDDELMRSYDIEVEHSPLYVTLTDVTGDGQDELLFLCASNGEGWGPDWYGAVADLRMYTIRNGEARPLLWCPEVYAMGGNDPFYEIAYSDLNGDFFVRSGNNGPGRMVRYSLDAGGNYVENTSVECVLPDPENEFGFATYLVNGQAVSEAVYNAVVAQMEADARRIIASTERVTDYWIMSVADVPEPGSILSDDEVYARILDMYVAGLQGDENVIESENFNFSVYQATFYSETEPLYTVGYALMDLNGDGREELLIADATKNQSADGIIFDIWSASEGKPWLFLRGWERLRLYLMPPDETGCYGFYFEGSDSASESFYEKGAFTVDGPVILNLLEYNYEDPVVWKLDDEGVAEETADALIAQWRSRLVPLDLTPLAAWRQY